MCYAYPGPRCSSHALATLQTKRDAFIQASGEHLALRKQIEDLLEKGKVIPADLDQKYSEAMLKATTARQEKNQAQAEFDATPAGQRKLELGMETLCSYTSDEWKVEHSERLEHFMDRLEAGRFLRTRRMQDLRKSQGYVELEQEDLPQMRSYSDMYFDIKAAREPKPVFVYGSLMNGLHNSQVIGQTKTSTEASVDGVALFANGNHFPYAVQVEGMDNEVHAQGELIEVNDDRFAVTLFKLDQLEGYAGADGNNHYNRVLRTVTTEDGRKVEAWMYIADESVAGRVVQRMPYIASGSWREHLSQDDTPWFNDPKYRSSSTSASTNTSSSDTDDSTPPWN